MLLDRNGFGNDSHCVLLLRGDALAESSPYAHGLTNNGAVSVVTPSGSGLPAGFTKALAFSGSNSLQFSDSADWALPADFTLEAWVMQAALGGAFIVGQQQDANNFFRFGFNTATQMECSVRVAGTTTPAYWTISGTNSVWTNIAVVKSGLSLYGFKDGVPLGAVTVPAWPDVTGPLYIGRDGAGIFPFTGQIASLRLSKGVPRWLRRRTLPSRNY